MRASTRLVIVVAIIAAVAVAWHLRFRAPAPDTPAGHAQTVSVGGVEAPVPESLDRPTTGYVVLDRRTGQAVPR